MTEYYLVLRNLHIGCAIATIALFVLLVACIVLGSIALKRGRTRAIRIAAFVAALATIGFLVTVARVDHPLGVFAAVQ